MADTQTLPESVRLVLTILIVGVFAKLYSYASWKARSRGRPLPPGPPRQPIVGNLFNIPKKKPWYGFTELHAQYGDVLYFRVLGQDSVVLGSPSAISDFLEKRTVNTSDRPYSPITRLSGNDWVLGLIPYGQRWRSYRRALWQYFHPGALATYRPAQRAVARTFLRKLLDKPANFKQHIRFSFSATVLKVGYGIDVEDEENEIIKTVDVALEGAGEAFVPGRFLVDLIPALRHVPSWIPGAGFQKQFAVWRDAAYLLKDLPFEKRNTAYTDNVMPYTTPIVDALATRLSRESGELSLEAEDLIKSVVGVTFEAGSDTTFSTLLAMFVAMSLYPEAQKKAQAELDAVIGSSRLPDIEDRDSLVYVNALVKECFRWHNVTPLGIAHRTIGDDEFQGYFIPGGTMLVTNVWACLHDPAVWDEPQEFRPERFIRDGKLDPDVLDPANLIFGAGRRICPGRYFADISIFLNVACVLHVFDIGPPLDDNGKPIKIKVGMTDGFLSHMEDSRCTIKPRSAEAEALIRSAGW